MSHSKYATATIKSFKEYGSASSSATPDESRELPGEPSRGWFFSERAHDGHIYYLVESKSGAERIIKAYFAEQRRRSEERIRVYEQWLRKLDPKLTVTSVQAHEHTVIAQYPAPKKFPPLTNGTEVCGEEVENGGTEYHRRTAYGNILHDRLRDRVESVAPFVVLRPHWSNADTDDYALEFSFKRRGKKGSAEFFKEIEPVTRLPGSLLMQSLVSSKSVIRDDGFGLLMAGVSLKAFKKPGRKRPHWVVTVPIPVDEPQPNQTVVKVDGLIRVTVAELWAWRDDHGFLHG